MRGLGYVGLVSGLALITMAADVFAVTITKPLPPNGAPITAVTDGQNCTVTNAGHYATAIGTTLPFAWSSNPTAAVSFFGVQPNNHIIRFMVNRTWAVANNYAQFTITVYDTGDNTSQTIQVYPISLDWKEGLGADRVVHDGPGAGEDNNTRVIMLDCKGQVLIKDVVMKAYHRINTLSQVGAGLITAHMIDGLPNSVSGSGCSAPLNVPAPYAVWKLNANNGVTSSWNPVTQSGTAHSIQVTGDTVSKFWDDIEVDIGIDQRPFLIDCSDGLGASMLYTVAELNVKLEGMTETEERDTGEILFFEEGQSTNALLNGSIERVVPDDITGGGVYKVRAEILDQDGNDCDRAEILKDDYSVWSSPCDSIANDELARTVMLRGKSQSEAVRDTRIRIKLMSGGNEIGAETCRDSAYVTVLKATVINPLSEGGDAVTTPAVGGGLTTPGNEYAFDNASPGAMSIVWRMKVEPDTSEMRSLIGGKHMQFMMDDINGSSSTWSNSHLLNYTSITNPPEWRATVDWSGLPSSNGQFGRKSSFIDMSRTNHGTMSVLSRPVEVFFTGTATNHPGSGTDPNWFYYYKNAVGGGDFGYTSTEPSRSESGGGDSTILIAPRAYSPGNHSITTTIDGGTGQLKVIGGGWSAVHLYFAGASGSRVGCK
jgi:hypothetical protein